MELMEDASCAWVSIFSYNLNALTQNCFFGSVENYFQREKKYRDERVTDFLIRVRIIDLISCGLKLNCMPNSD